MTVSSLASQPPFLPIHSSPSQDLSKIHRYLSLKPSRARHGPQNKSRLPSVVRPHRPHFPHLKHHPPSPGLGPAGRPLPRSKALSSFLLIRWNEFPPCPFPSKAFWSPLPWFSAPPTLSVSSNHGPVKLPAPDTGGGGATFAVRLPPGFRGELWSDCTHVPAPFPLQAHCSKPSSPHPATPPSPGHLTRFDPEPVFTVNPGLSFPR